MQAKRHIAILSTALCTGLLLAGSLAARAETPQETPQAKIQRANHLANANHYAEAISLYEQVLKLQPGQPALKENLSVLYNNYGAQLENDKQYEPALHAYDKALALTPNEIHAKQGKAGCYFYLAQEEANRIQSQPALDPPQPHDYSKAISYLEQARALDPSESAFKQQEASLYSDEAYELANIQKYTEAETPLQKAIALSPADPQLKASLANVYLSEANSATDDAQRQAFVDKALAVDSSEKIKNTAQQILDNAKPVTMNTGSGEVGDNANKGFTSLGGDNQFQGTGHVAHKAGSIQDMILDLENQLGVTRDPKATLVQRLETLETQVDGKPQEGPIATRTTALYNKMMGASAGMAVDPSLSQMPVESSKNSYLDKVFEVTDGKVVRWGKFPLRVYIEDPTPKSKKEEPKAPEDFVADPMPVPKIDLEEAKSDKEKKEAVQALYKATYRDAVIAALDAWKTSTDGFTNYVIVKNPGAADVQFVWGIEYTDEFADPANTPDVYKTYTPPSGKERSISHVLQIASMFAPGYFSLAPQAINSAMQYQMYKKLDVIRDESKITLGLKPTQGLSNTQAKTLIENMAGKEFGHVLGLKTDSPQKGDITYPELRNDLVQEPSARDLETLRELYNRPPNIILNVQ